MTGGQANDDDIFSILDEHGRPRLNAPEVALSGARRLELYRAMALVRAVDGRLTSLQRQGRIHYSVGATGQEASVIGSAAALGRSDWIFPTIREAGAALLRGWPLQRLFAWAFGNERDVGLGRDIPWVCSDRSVNLVSASVCAGTQLPHAVGVAYAMKLRREPLVALAYLGDGATSAPDFHVALNFAGLWKVPVVFLCQNNGWALGTPTTKQTASATIAVKARAYGLPGVRVDGNDLLAVHHVTKEAVGRARRGDGPTLVECVTYRVAPFSSSDDPTRYQPVNEVARWRIRDPIERMKRHLVLHELWRETEEAEWIERTVMEITEAVRTAERVGRPAVESLFSDVTSRPSPSLEEQKARLLEERKREPE